MRLSPTFIAWCISVNPTIGSLVKVNLGSRTDESVLPGMYGPAANYSVALISDTQLGMYDTYEKGHDGSEWKVELDAFVKALEDLEKLKPTVTFVAVTGDIVNQNPRGAKNSGTTYNPDLNKQQMVAMQNAMSNSKLPVFVIPGNHDLGNTFNITSLDTFYDNWGADYYSLQGPNTMFLFLNTQHFKNKNMEDMETFYSDQWIWIEEQLKLISNTDDMNTLVVFSHYPCYLYDMNEPEDYWNWPVEDRKMFFDYIDQYASTKTLHMHSGHTHQKIDTSDEIQNNNALATTKLLGDDYSTDPDDYSWQQGVNGGIQLLSITENDAQNEWFLADEIPSSWPTNSSTMKNMYSLVIGFIFLATL